LAAVVVVAVVEVAVVAEVDDVVVVDVATSHAPSNLRTG
jgi:hypothetical protein